MSIPEIIIVVHDAAHHVWCYTA